LAFLKPYHEILAFFNTFGFFGNKKAGKIWLYLAYFQSDRLGSGKTLCEPHIHYKSLPITPNTIGRKEDLKAVSSKAHAPTLLRQRHNAALFFV